MALYSYLLQLLVKKIYTVGLYFNIDLVELSKFLNKTLQLITPLWVIIS